jgi:hypothetical protein
MKKLFVAVILASAIGLGGCSTLGGTTGTVTVATIEAQILKILTPIDKYVALGCSAIPELASLVALANAGVAVGITTLGGAFCSAFAAAVPATPPASARKRFARRYGAGTGGLQYYCAGSICGWK